MFKSAFAKEFSKSNEALNSDIELDSRLDNSENFNGEVNNWFSHEKFKEILDKKEQTIFKSSVSSYHNSRFSSPRSSVASHISRLNSMVQGMIDHRSFFMFIMEDEDYDDSKV